MELRFRLILGIMVKPSFLAVVVFFCFFVSVKVFAQRIKGEIIGGMNFTQVDGDLWYGYHKFGINSGLGAVVPFGKNFSFCIEILYNQKGAYQKEQFDINVYDSVTNELIIRYNGKYKLKLDYLEVPLLIQYTDKDVITAGLGFSYGRLVNVKEWEHDTLNYSTSLNSGVYNRNDYNVLADVQFRIHKKIPKWKLNVRYAYSISKIRTRDFYEVANDGIYYVDPMPGDYFVTRNQYNNVITLRLLYIFNEKPPLAKQKK